MLDGMKAKLYGVPASHPSLAAELMLRHKGVAYNRVDLLTALHRLQLRALGFPGKTVPALRLDRSGRLGRRGVESMGGARVQGTREIALALDALAPQPPLFPRDPDRRRAVERAERWCDEVYQAAPRRIVWNAIGRDRSTIGTYLEGAKTPIPPALAERGALPLVIAARRLTRATDEAVAADLAALPGQFDRVDALLGDGVIGGDELNVADFQIATTTALLATMEDVQPWLEGRPVLAHARRVAPGYPGRMPRVFPAHMLPA